MPRFLITTVGTSLLTNRNDRPWGGWNTSQPLPDAALVDSWLKSADPIAASAEINTLRAMELNDADHVQFLHSDTDEGRFCAQRLAHAIHPQCAQTEEISLGGLDYAHHSFGRAGQGLKSLIRQAVQSVESAHRAGLVPVFCATGGFKAEIAFLNLFGALLGVEVVYIHEKFREIVTLPRLPLAWNHNFVRDNQNFFEWIDAEPRTSAEVENRLNANPDLRPLVIHADDGNAYLDAAGDLLWRASCQQSAVPRANWPRADAQPPDRKNGLSGVAHHRPQGWEAFVRQLCAIDCVTRVSYDTAAHGPARVKILDPQHGVMGVVFGNGNALPLRVETTASGAAQTELVAAYLRKLK